jgi:hypothetical protein
MVAKNDITGDSIISKGASKAFDKGFDAIDWSVKISDKPKNGDQRLNHEGKLERYYEGAWCATSQKEGS